MAESPLAFVLFICLLELGQILFDSIHMYALKEWGVGIFVFDIMNNVLSISSQFMIICIFLLLGCGWTITYHDLLEKENYIFIGGFGLVVNAIIGLCTYLDNGLEHQFHDYSGWPGLLLLLTRVFMYVFFIAQCMKTT